MVDQIRFVKGFVDGHFILKLGFFVGVMSKFVLLSNTLPFRLHH